MARQAQSLKPGVYVWAPEISPEGLVTVVIDLSTQLATIYRNDVRIGISTVSTGKPGHETPTGVFSFTQSREAKVESANAPIKSVVSANRPLRLRNGESSNCRFSFPPKRCSLFDRCQQNLAAN